MRPNPKVDAVMDYRKQRSGDSLSRPYDYIVRAMGWKHNTTVYADSAAPVLQHQGKYPRMTPEYESVNQPGLFFVGTLAHGKDWRRAAGGFVHGFRYTARALHRILEARYHGNPWPVNVPVPVPAAAASVGAAEGAAYQITKEADVDRLLAKVRAPPPPPRAKPSPADPRPRLQIVDRLCHASGPYQMFYTLADAVVLSEAGGGRKGKKGKKAWRADYMEEVPLDYLSTQPEYAERHRLAVMFGFDGQHRTLSESIAEGTRFEPWVWYWPPASSGQPKQAFRLIEHLATDWGSEDFQQALRSWLAPLLDSVQRGGAGAAAALPTWAEAPRQRPHSGLEALHIDLTIVAAPALNAVPVQLSRIVRGTMPGEAHVAVPADASTLWPAAVGRAAADAGGDAEGCFAGKSLPQRVLQVTTRRGSPPGSPALTPPPCRSLAGGASATTASPPSTARPGRRSTSCRCRPARCARCAAQCTRAESRAHRRLPPSVNVG
jgi:hypothetical protein